jgi:hypothetical protein
MFDNVDDCVCPSLVFGCTCESVPPLEIYLIFLWIRANTSWYSSYIKLYFQSVMDYFIMYNNNSSYTECHTNGLITEDCQLSNFESKMC